MCAVFRCAWGLGETEYILFYFTSSLKSTSPEHKSTMSPKPNSNNNPTTILKADYVSPNSSKTFIHALPTSSATSTAEKTQYLSALRKSVVQLQEDINTFLTSKMDEDKALVSKTGLKVDDKQEEDNYGEEGVEDDG